MELREEQVLGGKDRATPYIVLHQRIAVCG